MARRSRRAASWTARCPSSACPTQQHEIVCAETDAKGRAAVAWQAYEDGSYLIGVARQRAVAERALPTRGRAGRAPAVPAGRGAAGRGNAVDREPHPRPRRRVVGADGARDDVPDQPHDARALPHLDIYRPGTYAFRLAEPVRSSACGGYVVFTPGLDGGGLYSLVVRAEGTTSVAYPYHLQSAAYELDDGAPGIELTSGEWAAGTLDGRGVDVVDLYHFTVPRPHQLTSDRPRGEGERRLRPGRAPRGRRPCRVRLRQAGTPGPAPDLRPRPVLRRGPVAPQVRRRLPVAGRDPRRDHDEHLRERRSSSTRRRPGRRCR